ncbi:hypothetical protein EUGRSUZ_D02147 [Eucalyptus grandis]|uniref:Uncharacterized protein n=2 Tax=Eucalyptus grandis TaxID=71139 RepID=A0ACC3L7R0_EUCGR|nr:hypothetical protein EUGRSUZ_D02147 [Eucalyptus grandis]
MMETCGNFGNFPRFLQLFKKKKRIHVSWLVSAFPFSFLPILSGFGVFEFYLVLKIQTSLPQQLCFLSILSLS